MPRNRKRRNNQYYNLAYNAAREVSRAVPYGREVFDGIEFANSVYQGAKRFKSDSSSPGSPTPRQFRGTQEITPRQPGKTRGYASSLDTNYVIDNFMNIDAVPGGGPGASQTMSASRGNQELNKTASSSKTTFRARKVAHKKTYYDKKNCTHGVIADRDYERVSGNVATAVVYNMDHRTRGQDFRKARQWIIERGSLLRMSTDQDGKLFEIVWIKSEMTLINRSAMSAHLELWDFVANKDITDASSEKRVDQFMSHDVTNRAGNLNAAVISGDIQKLTNINDVDVNFRFLHYHKKYWSCVKMKKIHLSPGESHTHTVFHRVNYLYDLEQDNQMPLYAKAGVTTETLLRAQGQVSHVTSTGVPTLSGVDLDYLAQHKMYIREVKKWGDYFYGQTGNEYPALNAARNQVGEMQLEDHTEETG